MKRMRMVARFAAVLMAVVVGMGVPVEVSARDNTITINGERHDSRALGELVQSFGIQGPIWF